MAADPQIPPVRSSALAQVAELLLRVADGDMTVAADPDAEPDPELRAVLVGLNMLIEELAAREGARAEAEQRARNKAIALEQANSQLKRSNEALAASNIELSRFAYVAGHDLREPLRTLTGFSELLLAEYADRFDERGTRWLKFVEEGAERMGRMIRGLMDYSRVDGQEHPFELVDFNRVVKDAKKNLASAIRESGATIVADPLPTLPADGGQILQLFQNLIGNGIKFRRGELPVVRITAEESEDQWRFHVSDNGIGMAAEYLDRVFEPFKRLVPRRLYPGSGIGLAICRKVVERHGGRISVTSVAGKGSTFTFTMPTGEASHV